MDVPRIGARRMPEPGGRREDPAELPEILEALRRRWSSAGSTSVTDREIVLALRRVIEDDARP